MGNNQSAPPEKEAQEKTGLDVQTRPYQKGDEAFLNEIFKGIYQRDFHNEYWWWKYLNNPLGVHYSHCALFEDRIVGFAGGLPYRMKWKDRVITAAQITDLAMVPELRGTKSFLRLRMASMADIWNKAEAIYGFANNKSFRPYDTEKNQNYDFAFHVPRMVKMLNAVSLLKQKAPTTAAHLLGTLGNKGIRLAEKVKSIRDIPDIAINEINAFDDRFDVFWETISPAFKLMNIRDKNYLNWRYCRHPYYQYTIYAVENGDEIMGYVVLREDSDSVQRGYILEFFAPPERPDIQYRLLDRAVSHFRDRGVDIVICWMFRHSPFYKTFKRHLFANRRGELVAITTTTIEDDELRQDLHDPLCWHISCGDHEAF